MQLDNIIGALADRADDLLVDVKNEKEARTSLAEILAKEHPKLSPAERLKVISEVLAILEEEDFFDSKGGGDRWSDDADDGDEE